MKSPEEGGSRENIEEAPKLEWGPDLGDIDKWSKIQDKITELNSNLAADEKPWRLPTMDELTSQFDFELSDPKHVFIHDHWYWTSTRMKPDDIMPGDDSRSRNLDENKRNYVYLLHTDRLDPAVASIRGSASFSFTNVRLVRDTA